MTIQSSSPRSDPTSRRGSVLRSGATFVAMSADCDTRVDGRGGSTSRITRSTSPGPEDAWNASTPSGGVPVSSS